MAVIICTVKGSNHCGEFESERECVIALSTGFLIKENVHSLVGDIGHNLSMIYLTTLPY